MRVAAVGVSTHGGEHRPLGYEQAASRMRPRTRFVGQRVHVCGRGLVVLLAMQLLVFVDLVAEASRGVLAEFQLQIDAPIRVTHSSAGAVQVTWFALPLSELFVHVWVQPPDDSTANDCVAEVQHKEGSGELVVSQRDGCPPVAIRIGVPFHILERHQGWAIFPVGSAQRTTACSDGQDNDGDGLADAVDPGCNSLEDDDEANKAEASNFKFRLDSDSYGGAYFALLSWKGKPIIMDDGSQGSRFYLHNDRSSETNYSSGLQWFPEMAFPFFPRFYDMDFPLNPVPYNFSKHIDFKPWYPGSKLGENY
eukprot:COSAG06_NODE_12786_length_1330_cov_1.123477_1_plen_307_part_10